MNGLFFGIKPNLAGSQTEVLNQSAKYITDKEISLYVTDMSAKWPPKNEPAQEPKHGGAQK